MKVFAKLSNGNQAQIELKGDVEKIINYIENYEGDDLGNDIICEDFVEDCWATGVEIEK
jgi:hypothetical protein